MTDKTIAALEHHSAGLEKVQKLEGRARIDNLIRALDDAVERLRIAEEMARVLGVFLRDPDEDGLLALGSVLAAYSK